MRTFQKISGALAAAFLAVSVPGDLAPGTVPPPHEPQKEFTYYNKDAKAPYTLRAIVADMNELKQAIRKKEGLDIFDDIKAGDYPDMIDAFIEAKIAQFPKGMVNEGHKTYIRDSLTSRIKPDAYVANAGMVFTARDDKTRTRYSLFFVPDKHGPQKKWIASMLGVDPAVIKTRAGIDQNALADWVYYHEVGHAYAYSGQNERTADRYATQKILKEYALNDRLVATLQFIADFRIARGFSSKYDGCFEEIQKRITPESLTRYMAYKDKDFKLWPRDMKPAENLQAPLFNKDKDWSRPHNNTVIRGNEFKPDGSHLALARTRALRSFEKDPENAEYYMGVIEATQRLQTLFTAQEGESAYEMYRPISGLQKRLARERSWFDTMDFALSS